MVKKIASQIVPNTVMFVLVVAYMAGFTKVFGTANAMAGIGIIILTLVGMTKNMTVHPVRDFIGILLLNLSFGLASHFGADNPWLGIVFNFVILFAIGYFCTADLTKTMVIPYGFLYLFMLYSPVEGHDLVLRYSSLAAGAVFIMLVQFIVWGLKKMGAKKELSKGEMTQAEFDQQFGEDSQMDYGIDDWRENPEQFYGINLGSRVIHFHKARVGYALRLSVLTTITAFAAEMLALAKISNEGRWMTYTIFSLTEIFQEDTHVRTRDRLYGTVIGLVATVVVFVLVKSPESRGYVVMLIGYLMQYVTAYRGNMIMVTMTAVGSLISIENTGEILVLAGERLLFVIIGAILAVIANRYVLPTVKSKWQAAHPSSLPDAENASEIDQS